MNPAMRANAQPPANMDSNRSRAERYEDEKRRIIESCFSKKEADGVLLESYITHVRVTEDAAYPSSPPPPDATAANKKNRLILVAVRKSGRVRVHKARENPTGTFSIGKTWALDELSAIHIYTGQIPANERESMEKQWAGDAGFTVTLGKPYYWHAPTAKEKDFFIASLLKIYKKYTGGRMPELTGFLPHQIQQFAGDTSRTPSGSVSQAPPSQFTPPPPIPAAGAQRPQSPGFQRFSPAPPGRFDPSQVPPPRADMRPGTRDVPSSPMPEPVRSPVRMDRRAPSRENMRRSPELSSPSMASREYPPAIPPIPRQAPTQKSMQDQQNPQLSFDSREKQGFPPNRPPNGINQYPRPPPEPSNISSDFLPTTVGIRDRSMSSAQLSDRPTTATSVATSASSQAPLAQEPLPDRKRPFFQRPEPNGSKANLAIGSGNNSEFVTPATTPSAAKEEHSERSERSEPPVASQETPVTEQKEPAPKADYFAAVTIPDPVEPKPEPTKSDPPAPEMPVDAPITPTLTTAEPEEILSAKKSEDEHKPGSGLMAKNRAAKDVADKLRKAAFAASAFKPREGGGAARLKAMQEEGRRGNEPDGITGVVPAPLSRGMSGDSVSNSRPTTPATPGFKETPTNPLPAAQAPRVNLQRTATEDSVMSQQSHQSQVSDQSGKSNQQLDSPAAQDSKPQEPPRQTPERPPTPEKARSRSPQRKKRRRQEADIAKYSSSLGIDPRIFEGRGAEFNDLLTEFGWDGKLLNSKQKVDDLEAEVRREIGRAQATGWLGHVEQQESKVQELARAFDRAIEECEELDGLFTLYSHELDTLAADIEYIEAQSQGLQVQTANQKLLHNELRGLLTTLTIPKSELQDLHYGALDDARGVAHVEQSLSLLYKALITIDPDIRQNKQRRDGQGSNADRGGVGVYADREIGQMRAVREQKHQYREDAQAFIRRFTQHINLQFKRLEQTRDDDDTLKPVSSDSGSSINLATQRTARQELWLYNGMMLFVREVNSYEWKTLIKSYEINIGTSYRESFRQKAMTSRREARKPNGDEQEALFTTQEKEKADESLTSTAARKLTVKRGKTAKAGGLKPSLGDRQEGKPDACEVFRNILEQQAKVIAEEQNFIVSFFHLSSQNNVEFAEMVSSTAPEKRRLPNLSVNPKYEPDRDIASTIQQSVEAIYSFWLADLQGQLEWALSMDELQGVGVLYALEHVSFMYEDTYQEFITLTLKKLHDRLTGLFHKFVDEQVKAIEETKVKLKKRKGIISFMRTFPMFSMTVESMLPAEDVSQNNLEIRFIINDAYYKVLKAMWESLTFIAKDDAATGGAGHSTAPASGDPEDKEALNYHILLIENMNHYIEEVDTHHNVVLEEWKEKATHDMFTHLTQYTDAVIRRPLGKWLDFVESTEAMMKTNDFYQGIASKPSHSRSACKKVIKSHDGSEVRKGIETLKKRVEKHFGDVDDPTTMSKSLIARVFEECNLRYEHAYDRMKLIIDKVYDGGLDIDWKKEDVNAMFRR